MDQEEKMDFLVELSKELTEYISLKFQVKNIMPIAMPTVLILALKIAIEKNCKIILKYNGEKDLDAFSEATNTQLKILIQGVNESINKYLKTGLLEKGKKNGIQRRKNTRN